MNQNLGRPGQAPSPNQQIVLDALTRMTALLSFDHSPGYRVTNVTRWLTERQIGGGIFQSGYKKGAWVPWSHSTVRAHLEALVHRGHAKKQIVERGAYYRV